MSLPRFTAYAVDSYTADNWQDCRQPTDLGTLIGVNHKKMFTENHLKKLARVAFHRGQRMVHVFDELNLVEARNAEDFGNTP